MKVKIFCKYYPTENAEKIKNAILKIFPEARIKISDDYIIAETNTLKNFAYLLKKQRIRDSARSVLIEGMDERGITFKLNKQVMTVGKINFAVEDMPLGDVEVRVEAEEWEDIRQILDSVAPSTKVEVAKEDKSENRT